MWKNVIFDAYFFSHQRNPITVFQRKYSCSSAITWVSRYHSTQTCQNPITYHGDFCYFFINFWLIVFKPQNTRQSPKSKSLTRETIKLLFNTFKIIFKVPNLFIGSSIYIGNRPKLQAKLIIKNYAFTHTSSTQSHYVFTTKPNYM